MWGLFASAYFHGRERQYIEEGVRLRRQLESTTAEAAELRQAADVLNAPGVLTFRSEPRGPNAIPSTLYVDPARGLVLIASHLAPAPPGKTYEMWVIGPGHTAASAGLLQSRNDALTMHVAINTPAAVPGAEVIVTMENAGGAAQPSMPALISIPILPASR